VLTKESNVKQEIRTISLLLPYRLGDVNCYLIETNTGFFLIDTGCSNQRTRLDRELESAGCRPGNLRLIVLTHGDFDHAGNAAHLRNKFGAKIAMHHDDTGMVEYGDIFWNRKKPNILVRILVRRFTPIFFRFGRSERFKPDFYLEDGQGLSEFGLDAIVLQIPGHSKGSIGILTAGGDLIGGDLILKSDKSEQPHLNSIIDDLAIAHTSVEKLKSLNIKTIYPGHSKSFTMDMFVK
jgi:hydroxyacylglutathione hydrolase